jgi:hypothetical protein
MQKLHARSSRHWIGSLEQAFVSFSFHESEGLLKTHHCFWFS